MLAVDANSQKGLATVETLTSAIETYFQSERLAMFFNLAIALLVASAVTALYLIRRDGFSQGLGLAGLAVALLIGATSIHLLQRDLPHRAALMSTIQAGHPEQAIDAEARRIDAVLTNFSRARLGVAILALIALGAILWSRHNLTNGIAAGALVFVTLQVIVDHYSEARASLYATDLARARHAQD